MEGYAAPPQQTDAALAALTETELRRVLARRGVGPPDEPPALDRTAAYLQTAPTPDDAEGFRAAAGLALACIDAWHAWNVAQP